LFKFKKPMRVLPANVQSWKMRGLKCQFTIEVYCRLINHSHLLPARSGGCFASTFKIKSS